MTSISAIGQPTASTTPYPSASSTTAASTASSTSSDSSNTTSPPYVSPATRVDPQTGIAVLVVIDNSGEVTEQIPTRQVIDEYRRHQEPSQDGHASAQQASNHVSQNTDTSAPQVAGSSSVSPGSSSSGSVGTNA